MKEKEGSAKKVQKIFTKKGILITIGAIIVILGGTGVGLVKASENPAFCSICHNMESYYDSYKDDGLLAHKHAEEGVTCHDCHREGMGQKIEQGVKYVSGNYENPLEKHNFGTREFCLECHDMDEVKSETNFEVTNPHDSHHGDLECYTCHSMHQESEVSCQQCHTLDWSDDLDEMWKK